MGLKELAQAYSAGLAVQKWGPDWKAKLAQTEAQTRGIDANTRQTEYQTGNVMPAQVAASEANTRQSNAATAATEFDVQQKREKIERLKQLVAEKKIPVQDMEAVNAIIQQGELDLRKSELELKQKAQPSEINLRNATAEYNRGLGRQGAQSGQVTGIIDGKVARWDPANSRLNYAPEGFQLPVDSRASDARQGQEAAQDVLVQQADNALATYEKMLDVGFLERGARVAMGPETQVAKSDYQAKLVALAQYYGKAVLYDNRVAVADRQAYAQAIGNLSAPLTVWDPAIARRRLEDMKAVIAAARSGRPAAETLSTIGSGSSDGGWQQMAPGVRVRKVGQ